MKESLRLVFQLPFLEAVELLEAWLTWAWNSGIEAFERLGDTIANHVEQILVTLEHGFGTGVGRARRFCSDACKQAAHRSRRRVADYPQTTNKEVIIEG